MKESVPVHRCLPCGDNHLAVPLGAEAKFRTALEKLGYPLPPTP